jgi:hypothetical protein
MHHEPPGSRCRPWLVTLVGELGPDIGALLLAGVLLRHLVGWLGPVTWPSDMTLMHAVAVVLVLTVLHDLASEIVEQATRLGRAVVHALVRVTRWCVTRVRARRNVTRRNVTRRNVQP